MKISAKLFALWYGTCIDPKIRRYQERDRNNPETTSVNRWRLATPISSFIDPSPRNTLDDAPSIQTRTEN